MTHWPARLLLAALVLVTTGCVRIPLPTPETEQPPEPEPAESTSQSRPFEGHGHGIQVLMMGRSVMADWFDHWGWDGTGSVKHEGFALYYAELQPPPGLADSALAEIETLPAGTVVFFKLCFADFYGGDRQTAEAALLDNEAATLRVIEAAGAAGLPLVVATALPKVRSETDEHLVWAHDEYDRRLRAHAEEYDDVHVFDMRAVLVSNDGALVRGFARDPSDSHLNDAAYRSLDLAFFPFMTAAFAE